MDEAHQGRAEGSGSAEARGPQNRPPFAKGSSWLLLGLVLALTPLVSAAVLQQVLNPPDALIGAMVILSILLVGAATVLLRRRASARDAAPSYDAQGDLAAASGEGRPDGEQEEPVSRDPLTGLLTFQPFSQRLLEEFHRVKRHDGHAALILVDINHLSRINEQFGAPVGDQVLRQVTACLQMTKRLSDVLARMGDDEFGILLLECDDRGAAAFIERLHQQLARQSITIKAGDRSTSLWVGVCAGKAICDSTVPDADEILTNAVDDLNASRRERDRRRQRWQKSA